VQHVASWDQDTSPASFSGAGISGDQNNYISKFIVLDPGVSFVYQIHRTLSETAPVGPPNIHGAAIRCRSSAI